MQIRTSYKQLKVALQVVRQDQNFIASWLGVACFVSGNSDDFYAGRGGNFPEQLLKLVAAIDDLRAT